jgi:hypothetical protein
LRASEDDASQIASIVVKNGDFVVTFAVFKNIDVQGANLSVGSSQTTGSRNGKRVGSKRKDTFTRAKVFENDICIEIAGTTVGGTAVITIMGHFRFYLRIFYFLKNSFYQ